MNWYKQAQTILNQYQQLAEQSQAIQLIGTGLGASISIPGAATAITAREILERVKVKLAPVLIQNNVRVIDTSPISNPQAQGLAISHEPGIIHVDVAKIFNNAQGALPPTSQFDGVNTDPDIINSLIGQVANWIEGELFESTAHESKHVSDYSNIAQQGGQFTSVQEGPAEQFGRRQREQHVQPFQRSLPY